MADPRSYLFVPGQRPDRFAKAAASGADAIILDLEDAVGPEQKDEARAHVASWLADGGAGLVRINGQGTPWFDDDLAMLACYAETAAMVPKAEPAALAAVAARLPGRPLLALIESAAGLASAREGARAPGVARLAFGNLDFSADMGMDPPDEGLDPARFEIVLASRLAGLPPPVDGVRVELEDAAGLTAEVRRKRGLGFGAKLCIHPAQVGPVNAGFSPSAAEIDWARRIEAAMAEAAGSAVRVDGKMVDKPLLEKARRILANIPA
ncbi:HpcH/HpaI aldolase/citrate lyase family protein [Albimonas pacifica]|uniref:Citrate lyase subunit beta / citryl-CoA lyase n=1 Tax=Albimonas pacifica TaxID=1114924 RepID=A0A1I3IUR6_9RHOB|nr:CoA ester lyase [Albimonas pacifica]SFI51698.1 citrate lyase subunit beta / citryl-CoA lyase [Albimonas pacifica]